MDKQLYTSTTLQGAVVSFIALIVMLTKVDIKQEEITAIVSGIFGVIGLGLTIYGRIKANPNLLLGSKKLGIRKF